MAGLGVLLLQVFFLVLALMIIAAIVGLIVLTIGIVINYKSLKRKRKKSIPAVVAMVLGSVMIVPLMGLFIWGGVNTVQKDRAHRNKVGELAYSIEQEDVKAFNRLLAKGADPNLRVNETYPLEIAVEKGNLTIIKALLDAGADPNAPNKQGDSALMRGLGYATVYSSANYIERAKLLIDYGADVTPRSKSGIVKDATALILLAEHVGLTEEGTKGTIGLARVLLDKGVDINAQNNAGETALIHACKRGNGFLKPDIALIRFLIENGADKTIRDHWNEGKTAAHYFNSLYEGDDTRLVKDAEYAEILALLE